MTTQQPNTSGGPSHDTSYSGERCSRKRVAHDCSSTPPSTRRRLSNASLVLPYQPPHPLSINGLIRKHCRDRLYVHPLQWTSQHLELLGCRFVCHDEVAMFPSQQLGSSLPLPSEAIIHAAINRLRHPSMRKYEAPTVQIFLEACNAIPLLGRSSLSFNFEQKTVATVPTSGIFTRRSGRLSPTLAYLDLNRVGLERYQSIKPPKRFSPPVDRIKQKQRCRFQPSDEAEDPYIAAVLVALAQGLQHRQRIANGPVDDLDSAELAGQSDESFQVRLLALASEERSLYFYTATIPGTWLDGLNEPSRYRETDILRVSYCRIKLRACTRTVQQMKDVVKIL
ncbi:hypothetical protein F5Y14DRAFT_437188 [Nemania sp. NC0429]|nr:hypothetical protein F5Y14DRAFT_437188 [Nemania sp. NC0429]